jgi:hypothetical protein
MDRLTDALDSMTRRQIEALVAAAQRRLASCVLCGADGAAPVLASVPTPAGNSQRVSFMLCPACIERHRLPEGRADAG